MILEPGSWVALTLSDSEPWNLPIAPSITNKNKTHPSQKKEKKNAQREDTMGLVPGES
ncbi:hypothetical protein GCM10025794_35690 [Massilia kyonggiensis]